jgi:hypothetical protein
MRLLYAIYKSYFTQNKVKAKGILGCGRLPCQEFGYSYKTGSLIARPTALPCDLNMIFWRVNPQSER